jgi:hypothetical protein
MHLTDENYRPGLGNYYRSLVWHYGTAILLLPTYLLLAGFAMLLNTVNHRALLYFDLLIESFERPRRFIQCWIYLGTDPRVWDELTRK